MSSSFHSFHKQALLEALAQNVQDQAVLESLVHNVQDQALLEALAQNVQDQAVLINILKFSLKMSTYLQRGFFLKFLDENRKIVLPVVILKKKSHKVEQFLIFHAKLQVLSRFLLFLSKKTIINYDFIKSAQSCTFCAKA